MEQSLQQHAQNMFNAHSFTIEDAKVTGFSSSYETVKFETPVDLGQDFETLKESVGKAMRHSVHRDIRARWALPHSPEWAPDSCMAEAVLIADELLYSKNLADAGGFEELTYEVTSLLKGLIDVARRDSNSPLQ